MAGIGFELRKAMCDSKGSKRSGGYFSAAFTCFGGMLIGIILIAMIQIAADAGGIAQSARDVFLSYITNAMFISMLFSSILSHVVSRYVADMLFEERYEAVMPSLVGTSLLTICIGGIVFGAMVIASDLPMEHAMWLMLLFAALCLCWILMTYISLLRDYRQITMAFMAALIVAMLLLIAVIYLGGMQPEHMLIVLTVAYATVDAFLFRAIYRGFPIDEGGAFVFLHWLKRNPSLAMVGFLTECGLLGHFWIDWFCAKNGLRMQGIFACNPTYDFPAIVAYFCTIPSMIYFVAMLEPVFYKHYHCYLKELSRGRTKEVDCAREAMIGSIRRGVRKFAAIQLISCVLFITIGAKLLSVLNIGMTEHMLDVFRLFCIGYSLYSMGNMLMLLQMYFVNERRSTIAAGTFGIVVCMATLIEVHISGQCVGISFCVGAFLLLTISAIQLVQCLDRLEYHILCESSDELAPIRVKNKRDIGALMRSISPKRMRGILAGALVACVTVIAVSASGLIQQSWQASMLKTFVPKQSDEVILSPGMGYAPWADADETESMETTLVYVELRWAEWEPEEGVYDVDFVNDAFNMETYRAQDRQVVFRFICDEPGEMDHIDIPEWLYMKTGDGQHYDNDYGRGYSPNYANEAFIEAHANAIAALGRAFGGDDFFHYIELGSIGHWGEYHVNVEQGIAPLPYYDVRERYIAPYLSAFPEAHYMTRYPLLETTKHGFGLYNDMTGDPNETEYWLEQMKGGIWEQTGLPEQSDCVDAWKTEPIAGEYASTYEDSYFLHDNLSETLELLCKSHQSIIGPKIIVDESDADYTSASWQVLTTIGYRFTASQVIVDLSEENTVDISVMLENKGCAPIYDPCMIKFQLYDNDGECIWSQRMEDVNLCQLLPEETMFCNATIPREGMDDDEQYTLTICIEDDFGEKWIPMALSEAYGDMEYMLAAFSIAK